MKKVIILRGLPASGKTTWAKQQTGFKRVNKDDLRAMIDNGVYARENEEFIKLVRNLIIVRAIKDGHNVIVDDTNFGGHIADIKSAIFNFNELAEIEIKDFDTDVEECIKRDKKRPNSVGGDVIRNMYKNYVQNNSN